MIPQSFRELPVPLPPMLCGMANISEVLAARFIAFYYLGSNATWDDGLSCGTFPFYTVWEPWKNHVTMAIHLLDANLGYDDAQPEQCLFVDRETSKVYLAPIAEAERFLAAQHPPRQPLTPNEAAAEREALADLLETDMPELLSMDECRKIGMFESLFGPTTDQTHQMIELVTWLDRFITPQLIREYIELAKSGNFQAIAALRAFQGRVKISQERN